MEPKKINALKIKKEVIANLDDPAMSKLKGGTDCTCQVPCPASYDCASGTPTLCCGIDPYIY